MTKSNYQLKDDIFRYLIKASKTDDCETFNVYNVYFEKALGKSPRTSFMKQLLDEIKNDGFILISEYTNYQRFTITGKGFDFMSNGGYSQQHVKQQKAERHTNNEYKLVRWKVRWFWISQILALLAFGVSIIALFF